MAVPANLASIIGGTDETDGVEELIRQVVLAVRNTYSVGEFSEPGTTVDDALSAVEVAGESWLGLSDAIEAEIDILEEKAGDDELAELQACRSALMLLNLEMAKECARAGELEWYAGYVEGREPTPMSEIDRWNDLPLDEDYFSNLWDVAMGRANLIALLRIGTDDEDGGAPEPTPGPETPLPEPGSGIFDDELPPVVATHRPAVAGGEETVGA